MPCGLIVIALLTACAPAGGEAFAPVFARMQADPAFLETRIDPRFRMVETLVRGDSSEERNVDCSFEEISRSGWHLLPAAARLAQTGTTYGPPEEVDGTTRVVTLGADEGGADARYRFVLARGGWRLARVDVYTHLEAGEPVPPLPCGPGSVGPGESGAAG